MTATNTRSRSANSYAGNDAAVTAVSGLICRANRANIVGMRLVFASIILAFIVAIGGFTVEGPRGGAVDPIERLELSPRWTANSQSLLASGERGLGGGLEYAVDESLCRLNFIDGTDCAQMRAAIAEALELWQSGHPALAFTDVTGAVSPAFPLSAIGASGQGAEIDFFASTPEEFPPFRAAQVTGYTIFYERRGDGLSLANGTFADDVAMIESADIRFNASRCYYLTMDQARAHCLHFPSVALHEIGHALGIAHPEAAPQFNLDSDDDPTNRMAIDCRNPTAGLRASVSYDGAAVAVGRDVQGPGRWLRGLTWDDVAARDALYPHCGIEPLARWSGGWGALAVSGDGRARGQASLEASQGEARAAALADCSGAGAGNCEVVASFEACFATATGSDSISASAQALRPDAARVNAVLACAEAGGTDCRVTEDLCAYEPTLAEEGTAPGPSLP